MMELITSERMMARLAVGAKGRILSGIDEEYRWLEGLLRALVVLNLADALFTLWWIHAGLATEANVLMRDLVDHGAMVFVLAKIALVSLGALFLWLRRTHALAVCAVLVTFLAYYAVFLYHIHFTSGLVIARFGL
jgi:hypothetical protein